MDDLFKRGRQAFSERLYEISPDQDLPLGLSSVAIITYEDFIKHVEACYEFVRTERRSILILGKNGEVEMLVCRHALVSSTR